MSKHTLQMNSGSSFDFKNLEKSQFTIEDIAHALSRICRFGGHTSKHYSVAEHSLLVALAMKRAGFTGEILLKALLHDAAEFVLGDVPSPLKGLLPEYKKLETEVEEFVFRRLRVLPISPEEKKSIKLFDLALVERESLLFMTHPVDNNIADLPDLGKIIPKGLGAEAAKRQFLNFFEVVNKTEDTENE